MTGPDSRPLDSHFARNTFSISAVEFFWGLGLPLVTESAFLQIYLRQLGASQQALGLVPAIMAVGYASAAPFSSLVSSHFHRKKGAVILAHVVASLPFVLFAALSALWEQAHTAGNFLAAYAAFAILLGIGSPIWQNFLVNIFTPARSMKALSIMWFAQVAARIFSGFVLVDVVQRFAFSRHSACVVFAAVGVFFAVGSLFFLFAHEEEPPEPSRPLHSSRVLSTLASFRGVISDRRFALYLLSTLDFTACITALSFYATFAVERRGISAAVAAGGFTVAVYGGGLLASLFLGMLGFLSLKGKLYLGKTVAMLGMMVLVFAPSLPWFLLSSALIGFARNTYSLTNTPAIKLLAQKRDATDHFSLAPFLLLPFGSGIPALAGHFLEKSNSAEDGGFALLFLALAALVGLTTLLLSRVRFPDETGGERAPDAGVVGAVP